MGATATVKTVELGEYRVNYASEGSGPTMIMLHGSDKREDWRVWEPLMSLSSQYTLVVPDLVGFGGSTVPVETPDYRVQATVVHELMDRLGISQAILVGRSWGGQVALEVAINWPKSVESLILISSTYDKSQLPRLEGMKRPALIVWAEDDLVAQLKGGYLLRDSIGTSRLEVLEDAAKDPSYDFTAAHKLQKYKKEAILSLIRDFLVAPDAKIAQPPELEPALRGLALKEGKEQKE
jgi:pimeloyl-ACP methyl ester carboxylesterase